MQIFSFRERGGRQTALATGATCSRDKGIKKQNQKNKAKSLSTEKVQSLQELVGVCSLPAARFRLLKCTIGALQAQEGLMVIRQHSTGALPSWSPVRGGLEKGMPWCLEMVHCKP